MSLSGNLVTLLVLFAGVLAAGLATAAWWNRDQPGIYWFAIHVGLVAVWSFVGFGGFIAADSATTRTLGLVANGLGLPVVVSWFLFVFVYLGYRERVDRFVGLGLVFGVGGLYVGLQTLAGQFNLFLTTTAIVQWSGYDVLSAEPSVLGSAITAAIFLLFFIGLGLILNALLTGRLRPVQAAIFFVATLVPVSGGVLQGLLLVPSGVPFIQQATAFSVSLYAVSFNRYDLFTFSPVTERVGVDRAFEELGAGVLVTEPDGQIIRVNQPCCLALGMRRGELLGRDLSRLLAEFDLTLSSLPAAIERNDRYYRITESAVRDVDSNTIGRSVLLTDMTEQRLREQRLDVLNRVLRHNLRNDLQVLRTAAERLTNDLDGENGDIAREALVATKRLDSTCTKARAVEQVVESTQETAATGLTAALTTIVESHRREFPNVSFTLDTPDGCLISVPRALELAFENIVENAAEHNDAADPQVKVTVTDEGGDVTVTVSDNGPGIDAHELSVLQAGEETDLEHGSGIGLWAVQWSVDSTPAEVTYESSGDGTEVSVSIPREPASESMPTPLERQV